MPDRTPRVLQLLGPSTGGIRRHVSYLTEVLRGDGWDVDIAGPAGVLDDLDHVVEVPNGVRLGAVRRARRALEPIIGDYDVVHAHGLKAGWLATTIARRPPVVLSVHNLVLDEVAGRSAPALRFLEERLPGRVERTIAISSGVARRFADARGSDRIVVIPPAGPPPSPQRSRDDVRAGLGLADGDDLVVTAARLNPQKDFQTLVSAAARAKQARPGLRWFVFGEGPSQAEVEQMIRTRGLEGVVVLAGSRPTVDDELAAADVVAVTSRWESGPLVVLEALALGQTVVSTRVGLAPDVIGPDNGRLVDVGDSDGLASALVDVLADPPERGPGLTGSAARFAPDALVREVESVYRELSDAP